MYKTEYEYTDTLWGGFTDLVISHDGEEIERYNDRGEPEDNSFRRDWNWIASELYRAYKLGVRDGRSQKDVI